MVYGLILSFFSILLVHRVTNFCTFSETDARMVMLKLAPSMGYFYFALRQVYRDVKYKYYRTKRTISLLNHSFKHIYHTYINVLWCCVNYTMVWDSQPQVTLWDFRWDVRGREPNNGKFYTTPQNSKKMYSKYITYIVIFITVPNKDSRNKYV